MAAGAAREERELRRADGGVDLCSGEEEDGDGLDGARVDGSWPERRRVVVGWDMEPGKGEPGSVEPLTAGDPAWLGAWSAFGRGKGEGRRDTTGGMPRSLAAWLV